MAEKFKAGDERAATGERASSKRASRRRADDTPRARKKSPEADPGQAAGNLAVQRSRRDDAAGRLPVSQPGDAHEREADRIADTLVGSSPSGHAPAEPLRPEAPPSQTPRAARGAAGGLDSVGGGGALPEAEREFFEPRLGADLSGVRLHTDEGAAESAAGLRARAYTAGRDVFFGEGEYAPQTNEGRRLLAHELAHVVQQESGGGAEKKISRAPGDPPDAEVTPEPTPDAAPADPAECKEEPAESSEGDMGLLPPAALLYTENEGGLFVVPASEVSRGGAPTEEESVVIESETACELYDRISLETAFADAGAPVASDVYIVSPEDGEIYYLIWSFYQAQSGGESAVAWDDVAEAMTRVVDPETFFGPAAAATAGPVGPGPWAPPGGQPIPFYIGNMAHIGIALEYLAAHAGDAAFTNFTPVSTLLDALTRLGTLNNPGALSASDLAARPDIINLSRLHLYEIKPYTAAAQGAAEAAYYVAVFAKAGVLVSLGPSSEPGTSGVIPAPGGYFTFASPAPGVIIYQYRRGIYVPVPVPVPVPEPVEEPQPERRWYKWRYWEEATGLTGIALLGYLIVSEGSRLYPPRNLVPVP